MMRIALLLLFAASLGGCAVYPSAYGPGAYAYAGPGVVVAGPRWGHRGGWRR